MESNIPSEIQSLNVRRYIESLESKMSDLDKEIKELKSCISPSLSIDDDKLSLSICDKDSSVILPSSTTGGCIESELSITNRTLQLISCNSNISEVELPYDNIVIPDISDGTKYRLIIESGILAIQEVDNDSCIASNLIVDSIDGVVYELQIENKILGIKEI